MTSCSSADRGGFSGRRVPDAALSMWHVYWAGPCKSFSSRYSMGPTTGQPKFDGLVHVHEACYEGVPTSGRFLPTIF